MEEISPHQLEELLSVSESLFGLNYHDVHYFKINKNELIITACFDHKLIGFLKIILEKDNKVRIDCIGVSKKVPAQRNCLQFASPLFSKPSLDKSYLCNSLEDFGWNSRSKII